MKILMKSFSRWENRERERKRERENVNASFPQHSKTCWQNQLKRD